MPEFFNGGLGLEGEELVVVGVTLEEELLQLLPLVKKGQDYVGFDEVLLEEGEFAHRVGPSSEDEAELGGGYPFFLATVEVQAVCTIASYSSVVNS